MINWCIGKTTENLIKSLTKNKFTAFSKYLHTVGVTGSIPVAPTKDFLGVISRQALQAFNLGSIWVAKSESFSQLLTVMLIFQS